MAVLGKREGAGAGHKKREETHGWTALSLPPTYEVKERPTPTPYLTPYLRDISDCLTLSSSDQ